MLPTNSDKARKHRTATSRGMKRSAKQRQCPKCKRKAAVKTQWTGGFQWKWCRWDDCDYAKGGYVPLWP